MKNLQVKWWKIDRYNDEKVADKMLKKNYLVKIKVTWTIREELKQNSETMIDEKKVLNDIWKIIIEKINSFIVCVCIFTVLYICM